MNTAKPAILVLEDGYSLVGRGFGASGVVFGEAVFSTGMTGYQETLTDPSYCGQIVVMTAPHIGNTGINLEDSESSRMWPSGFVIRELSRVVSNWRATGTLADELATNAIVGIEGVDTRALTRHLRERGAMRMGIFSDANTENLTELISAVNDSPVMLGASFTDRVTTSENYVITAQGEKKATCVALDLGIKSMTPQRMSERGIEVHVVNASTSWKEITALNPDGIFLSNGPGDPASAVSAVALVKQALSAKMPLFGICFGHQILGRALGLETYKMQYGHRGINQPVKDLMTGKVEITAHNHGFAVRAPGPLEFDTPYGRARISHICLNDNVVEGVELLDQNAFSVQYHPEAAAGPHDSDYLFDRFLEKMGSHA
jgi:carbamoyl-phosphate synthase small subunit